MSLFDPTAKLFAFPPLPDLPINQPALGDNIAWSFDEGADYDYWSNFESGFDDSWVCLTSTFSPGLKLCTGITNMNIFRLGMSERKRLGKTARAKRIV
jgi:hypothetical protein